MMSNGQFEPIAIVSMACRLPGGVRSPQDFWELLAEGRDAVVDVPDSRWDTGLFYSPNPDEPGRYVNRQGGYLTEPVDRFDAAFFGISPVEAAAMDPQHRLLLETSWEAWENAGIPASSLKGTRTGVWIGISASDYTQAHLRSGDPRRIGPYDVTGSIGSTAAGRLSYFYDLRGPSMAVDTACSSSLTAIDIACAALQQSNCDLALAGGVNLILSPESSICFSRMQAVSPDGRSKAFDASANGFGRGEGCGLLVLERLADARRNGRQILAVIRSSAVNQDGRSNGLTAPNGNAQKELLRLALDRGGLTPDDIGYLEAHGTGTPLGDPIEMEAIAEALCSERSTPLMVGSVKTNIGHLECAAGVAGVIKTVLSILHGAIPAHLHLTDPSPHIPWSEIAVKVPVVLTEWPAGSRPRRAGVSSFGFGGTNAHIVIEEVRQERAPGAQRSPVLLCLSGKDVKALDRSVAGYAAWMKTHRDLPLEEIGRATRTTRSHLEERLALVSQSHDDSISALESGKGIRGRASSRRRLVFAFTGQGSQYLGMGSGLYRDEPVFRDAFDQAARYLDRDSKTPIAAILVSGSPIDIDDTACAQPAIFAVGYALAELFTSWSLRPEVMFGHSLGEFIAACRAGVFSLEDACGIVALRARLMAALPRDGGMAAVFTDGASLAPLLDRYRGRLAVAACNSPVNTVVSGKTEALDALLSEVAAKGVRYKRLAVSHAFHSPSMEPAVPEFERALRGVTMQRPSVGLVSNLSFDGHDAFTTPAYWVQQMLRPVLFEQSVRRLSSRETVFLEIGPHPVLGALGQQTDASSIWIPSLCRGKVDAHQILESLGALYVRGVDVDWASLGRPVLPVHLPNYSFENQRHWLAPAGRQDSTGSTRPQSSEVRPRGIAEALEAMVLENTGLQNVDRDANLLDLGLDSLRLMRVRQQIAETFKVEIPIREFFASLSTIDRIAAYVGGAATGNLQPGAPSPAVPAKVPPPPSAPVTKPSLTPIAPVAQSGMEFSLFYFSSQSGSDAYKLLIEGAKFADRNGFTAVWTPERHFHDFGGPYPNPTITCAALASVTKNIRLRAGSTVILLHDPVRFAEDWAMVDNLSNGRVDLALALGWNSNDFIFAPDRYENRSKLLPEQLGEVRRLWAGEAVERTGGKGETLEVQTYPRPVQRQIPIWFTAAGNPETFQLAGRHGANLLTYLEGQTIDELREKIALYREARREHGHEGPGHVTLMLHTFLGSDYGEVVRKVDQPLRDYLKSGLLLRARFAASIGKPVDELNEEDLKTILDRAVDRYLRTSSLIGTPESCRDMVARASGSGVDEIACLVDFGIDFDDAMLGLESLRDLKDAWNTGAAAAHPVRQLPLSAEQRALPVHRGGYEAALLKLSGPLAVEKLESAFRYVASRHEALRTVRVDGDSQWIASDIAVAMERVDLGPADAAPWLARYTASAFDLQRGPLFRVALQRAGEGEHHLVFLAHRLIADAWSVAVVLREVGAAYSSLVDGRAPELPAAPSLSRYIESPRKTSELSEAWWRRLASAGADLTLPDRRNSKDVDCVSERQRLVVEGELLRGLRSACREHGITLFMLLLGTWQTLLWRVTEAGDIPVWIPLPRQPAIGDPGLVGQCTTMLPAVAKFGTVSSWREFFRQVKETVLGIQEHQDIDLSALQVRTATFHLERVIDAGKFHGLDVSVESMPAGSPLYDIGLNAREQGGRLVLDLEYRTAALDAATAAEWSALLLRSLEAVAADDGELYSAATAERKADSTQWFPRYRPAPQGTVQLFCLPYAGSGAAMYRSWQTGGFPPEIQVVPVQLPGREERFADPPLDSIEAMADALTEALTLIARPPYAFFGYSMGALIAFETAKRLRRRGFPMPSGLLLAAHRAPQYRPLQPPIWGLPDAELLHEVMQLGGTPVELLSDPDLVQFLLPTVRADLKACDQYRCGADAPLSTPFAIFGGTDDPYTDCQVLTDWQPHSSEELILEMLPGKHFFFHENRDLLIDAIIRCGERWRWLQSRAIGGFNPIRQA